MSLMDDFNNMVFFQKNKTRTSELKKECNKNIINYIKCLKNYLIKFMKKIVPN